MRLRGVMLACALSLLSACAGKDVVTMGAVRAITPGMTYEQVVSKIGKPGRIIGRDERVEGALVPKDGKVVYLWRNKDGSTLTAAFLGGRVSGLGTWGLS